MAGTPPHPTPVLCPWLCSKVIEHAGLPHLTPEERRRHLNFVVVGGGPTGVELAAELHDLVQVGRGARRWAGDRGWGWGEQAGVGAGRVDGRLAARAVVG